jgi:peptidoglycan/LPS O-acetylase OafA/YrhL
MPPDNSAPAFSSNLAALRGIAACMVVVFHALLVFQLGSFDDPHRQAFGSGGLWQETTLLLLTLFNGHGAVIIFFVLSGVVLTLSYERERDAGALRLLAYYIKRGARLWPLLAVTAVGAFLLREALLPLHDPAPYTSWVNGYYARDADLVSLLRNILALDATLNYPAWTIYIEIAASLLFPALTLLARTPRLTAMALAAAASLTLFGSNAFGVGQYLLCFMSGIALAKHGAAWASMLRRWPRPMRIGLLLLAWVAVLAADRVIAPSQHMHALAVLVFTSGATVIVAHLYHAPPLAPLGHRALGWLGEISYGTYLLHFPVLMALAQLLSPFAGALTPGQALAANLLLAVLSLAVVLPLASLSYRWLEAPCQQAGRWLAKRVHAQGQQRRARLGVALAEVTVQRSLE